MKIDLGPASLLLLNIRCDKLILNPGGIEILIIREHLRRKIIGEGSKSVIMHADRIIPCGSSVPVLTLETSEKQN